MGLHPSNDNYQRRRVPNLDLVNVKKSPTNRQDVEDQVASQQKTIEKLHNDITDMKHMMSEFMQIIKSQQAQLATPLKVTLTSSDF